jgi:histidinol dehydrogenase
MKIFVWHNLSAAEKKIALARPRFKDDAALMRDVSVIVEAVKTRGDAALREFAAKFDGGVPEDLRVSPEEIAAASGAIAPQLRSAMTQAKANIEAFHKAEKPHAVNVETMPGVICELQWRAIDTVGIYIPGGTAPLFSTVLMLALPAKLAGCRRVILCTPPQRSGKIHAAVLAAAELCGVAEIYAVGGAQAIAAFAYGTQSIPKTDKIFGPGNAYVTKAKQLVAQDADGAAIDMPAGPSEVMVIADGKSRAQWVAADLLAQAEHDTMAQAILVTTDTNFAKQVQEEVAKQLSALPRRSIAEKSIAESRILVVKDRAAAIEVANSYAPEHLIIHHEDAATWVPEILHAGSVFVGAWTPESAGDYASGTNHVLPTYGYARAYNGVNLLSFMKSMSVQTITREGLRKLGGAIMTMAGAEGLDAHAAAVKVRLEAK